MSFGLKGLGPRRNAKGGLSVGVVARGLSAVVARRGLGYDVALRGLSAVVARRGA